MKNTILSLLLLFSTLIYSQELSLKGTVIERETDLALGGATIQVVGSETGVITDFDGNFEITLSIGDKIKVSYVGMKTIELPILTSPISVYMENDINQL